MAARQCPNRQHKGQAVEPTKKGGPRKLAHWWPILSERDGAQCFYCWKPLLEPGTLEAGHDDATTIEHVLAKTKGGGWIEQNLVLACAACNCLVSNHSIAWKISYRDEAIAKRLAARLRMVG